MSLKNPMTTPEIDPGTVRLVAQRLNHYATPGPIYIYISGVKNSVQYSLLYIYIYIYEYKGEYWTLSVPVC
jgi:hypothetical protein